MQCGMVSYCAMCCTPAFSMCASIPLRCSQSPPGTHTEPISGNGTATSRTDRALTKGTAQQPDCRQARPSECCRPPERRHCTRRQTDVAGNQWATAPRHSAAARNTVHCKPTHCKGKPDRPDRPTCSASYSPPFPSGDSARELRDCKQSSARCNSRAARHARVKARPVGAHTQVRGLAVRSTGSLSVRLGAGSLHRGYSGYSGYSGWASLENDLAILGHGRKVSLLEEMEL
jgi:hypothetical protein